MPQEQIQQQDRTLVRPVPKEPRRHKVIILNDDFTTFDFVIMLMMTVFMKTQEEAYEIAETTHMNQSAIVGIYTLDIARSKVDKATKMARDAGFPLRFDIQEE
ncbi:MAG: ATP-dependent Clp protease adaptor ClpS [Bacteroidales bacterium]|nr:ATP-dependent Clp protease adaptor ClpS [Bacteroidales bacterium]